MALYVIRLLVISIFAVQGFALPRLKRPYVRQENSEPGDQSWIQKWAAVGDSYAAGIGAGNSIDPPCSRYDNAYPNLINNDERLSGQQTFEFKACSGAVTDDVAKQADSLSYGQDAITVSSGGNDALLVTLLNQCIYGWHYTIGCDKARELSKNAILNDLPGRLDNLYTKLKAKLSRQGTVYVTAYGRFFDDTTTDCDKVSWHWWPWPLGVLNYQYLTQQRRTDLNALVDLVNTALQEAVNRAGDQFVLVTWDSAFGDFEGRYCEPSVQEPAPNRADLLFYLDGTQEQLNTKRQEENETFPESSFEGQVQALIEEGKREFPGNVTDPNVVQLISLPISDVRGRIFHPLQIGHSIIANKVLFEMSQRRGLILGVEAGVDVTDVAEVCPIIIPIGDDPTIHTDSDLNANFPKYWILTDGNQDIAALYFRMRDKACQRICDAATIQGVPSQFVRANRIGSTGCQYTIKISEEKEAYFYTTNDGQNCYDATEDMINAYGTSKDSSWINGPNPYEFYQIGVRDINTIGPGSTTHDPFPLDTQHIDYLHFACRRVDFRNTLEVDYDFEFRISNWDDGNYGKSIQRKGEDECGLAKWKYEPETTGLRFHDGTVSDHWGSFSFGIFVRNRCGEKVLESVLGLKEGTVKCPNGNPWSETLMFST